MMTNLQAKLPQASQIMFAVSGVDQDTCKF
jgi:hypothetical protein